MSRLPKVGGDQGQWGDILNDFLSVEHNADGTLKKSSDITDARVKANNAVPKTAKVAGHDFTGGDISLSKIDIGLGQADNTSDANKPISIATQTALDSKLPANMIVGATRIIVSATEPISPQNGDLWIQPGGVSTPADTTAPGVATNFSASAGNTQNVLTWTNPTDVDFAGVKVVRKAGGYPTSHTDGTVVYTGTGTTCTDTGRTNGVTDYYAIYSFDNIPNYSTAAQASATPNDGNTAPAAFTPTISSIVIDGATVTFATTDPENNPLTYKVAITTSVVPPSDWSSYVTRTSPYSVTGLTANTTYYAHVQASDGTLTRIGSSVEFTTITAFVNFEEGTNGTTLSSTIWTPIGSPTVFQYSNTHVYSGTLAGKMTAPTGVTSYAECKSTAGMTSDTAMIEFALYLSNTTGLRQILGSLQSFWVALDASGTITVVTDRTATGYNVGNWTTIGSYTIGYNRFRIQFNFTNDTFKMWKWDGSTWLTLKSSSAPTADIPMKATTNFTQSDRLRFTCYDSDTIWFDDIKANNDGLA